MYIVVWILLYLYINLSLSSHCFLFYLTYTPAISLCSPLMACNRYLALTRTVHEFICATFAIQIVEHLSTRDAICFIFTAMHFSIIFISIFLLLFLSILWILFRYIFYQILPRAKEQQEKSGRGYGGRPGRLISLRSFLAFVVTRNWYFMAVLISAALKEEGWGEGWGEGAGTFAISIRFS